MDEHAPWLTSTLWPDAERSDAWLRRGSLRFIGVPNAASPTQLIPFSVAAIRATADRASDFRPRAKQLRDAVGTAALLGLAALRSAQRVAIVPGDTSIVEHLRAQVDHRIDTALVLCGPPRANQKPVLQLLDRRGVTVAFAKIAWNELTTELLRTEERALSYLAQAPCTGFSVPKVLGQGDIGAGQWLALSAVTVTDRVPHGRQRAYAVARAIEATAPRWRGPTAQSSFLAGLLERARPLPIASDIVNELSLRHANREMTTGAWHGDFVPWNFLSGASSTAVWDWERFDPAVPVGFDRLHFALQTRSHGSAESIAEAAEAVDAELPELLPELNSDDAAAHFDWYLAELLCRYEHDVASVEVASLAERVREVAAVLRRRGALV